MDRLTVGTLYEAYVHTCSVIQVSVWLKCDPMIVNKSKWGQKVW